MLEPLAKAGWGYGAAAHLLNRAGFGGTPGEIGALERLGLEGAVEHLMAFEKVPDETSAPGWARPDPERAERFRELRRAEPERRRELQREEQRRQRQRLIELRHWWLRRMAEGRRPLQEKLTLFWHGHFATSMQKVRDAYLMWLQNDTFRRLGSGRWLDLLIAVAKDPAMLIWLDQGQSRKEHPNENFAREVMELFTLGEGHYTERDVTEAARAFTGWAYDRVRQQYVSRPRWHDEGPKAVLGLRGMLRGEEVLAHLVAQAQADRFIVGRLWGYFAGTTPAAGLVEQLAEEFRRHGRQFQPLLGVLFRSRVFYGEDVVRAQVKSPVHWLVSSVRQLERVLPPPLVASAMLQQLGQELFAPPNVKGWDGGLAWISTNSLMHRYNLAAMLVSGRSPVPLSGANRPGAGRSGDRLQRRLNEGLDPISVEGWLGALDRRDADALFGLLERRLFQGTLREQQAQKVRSYLEAHPGGDAAVVREAIRWMMCTPDYQLT